MNISNSIAAKTYPFKPIPGTHNLGVSEYGEVVSYSRRENHKGFKGVQWVIYDTPQTLLKNSLNKGGYLRVSGVIDGKQRDILIHQAVLMANGFFKPFVKAQVRHLDGDRKNNHLTNLKWGSHRENSDDTIKHMSLSGTKNPSSKLSLEAIKDILLNMGKPIRYYMEKYNCLRQPICGVRSGTMYKRDIKQLLEEGLTVTFAKAPDIKVFCNENGKTYNSIRQASKDLKISHSSIGKVVSGMRNDAKGYTFKKLNTMKKIITTLLLLISVMAHSQIASRVVESQGATGARVKNIAWIEQGLIGGVPYRIYNSSLDSITLKQATIEYLSDSLLDRWTKAQADARYLQNLSSLTTNNLAEGGSNLYFTNARARSAISLTTTGSSGAATYNSGTGVLNIPVYAATFPGNNNASAYSAGTAYTITTSFQKVDFGTTDPVITIPAAGTYAIYTNVKLGYNLATVLLTTRDINLKLRRTNNTAADITNAASSFQVPLIATALTGTAGDCDVPAIIYTTANNNDVIELWGMISSGLSTGSALVQEASVTAIRIF